MAVVTKPIMLDETGKTINASLATIADYYERNGTIVNNDIENLKQSIKELQKQIDDGKNNGILYGENIPTQDLGKIGDIYFQIEGAK